MALSKRQIILLKQAQREAGLGDEDYREAIATVSGMADCRSSKDGRLTDEHWDGLLSFFEAIFERRTQNEECKTGKVFRTRGYWAERNRRGNTSRDRFTEAELTREVLGLETRLNGLGFGFRYLQGIQNRVRPFSLMGYLAALRRTVRAKSYPDGAKGKELEPF